MTTNAAVSTFAIFNQRNAQFSKAQAELREERVKDERLLRRVLDHLAEEAARGIPIYYRKTFEALLEDAANAKTTFQTEPSRKGGKTPKSDPLSKLIAHVYKENPQITAWQLLYALKSQVGKGVIISIDAEPSQPNGPRRIHFVATDGKVKTAVSGLKHRLSRVRNQNSVSLAG
jgi:hypothetical protein